MADLESIRKLEVPIVVRLGERAMSLREVMDLVPGAIIELDKMAEDLLDLMVNNKVIGQGTAVKVGENFGLRVAYIGGLEDRLNALEDENMFDGDDEDLAALADALLGGQL